MAPWDESLKTMRPEDEIFTFARSGNLQGLKAVVNAENINFQDPRGHSPLILCCCNGFYDAARLLLDAGADVDLQDHTGNTALMGASFNGHLDIVKLLIAYGADPKLENPQGLSPQGFAKLFGRSDVQHYLGAL